MQKILSIACATLLLSLTACQKNFDLNTPLFDKAEVKSYPSVAYIKTGEFDLSKSTSTMQVIYQGTTLTKWSAQERYVYLSKPADQDVTVTLEVGTHKEDIVAFTKGLSSDPGYQVAPEGYAKLSTTTVTIPKGQTKSSVAITIEPGDKYDEISKGNASSEYFVVPVRVKEVTGSTSVGVSQDFGTYFIPIYKSYQNVSFYTRDPQGTPIPSSDLTFDVSSVLSFGGQPYSKEYMYDGDPSSAWYADYSNDNHWFSAILNNGTKKFSYILLKTSAGEFAASEQIKIETTTDGKTWTSQGVLATSYIRDQGTVVIRFMSPVEAKGVKISSVPPVSLEFFTVSEVNFYAEN